MTKSGLCLIAMLLSITIGVDAQSACLTELSDVVLAEVSADTSVRRTYVLCPDTEFITGVVQPDGTIADGSFPLSFKANTTVMCGESGSISNNCRISSGDVGILLSPFDFDTAVNGLDFGESFIMGITVADIFLVALRIDDAFGSVEFIECAIVNSVVGTNVLISVKPPSSRRRAKEIYKDVGNGLYFPDLKALGDGLSSYWYGLENRRLQQTTPGPVLRVVFQECRFEGNDAPEQFAADGGLNMILVDSPNVHLKMNYTTIESNSYPQYPLPAPQATAKSMIANFGPGNLIELTNNCFIDNIVHNWGLVITNNNLTTIVTDNNYVSPVDASLSCPFMALIDVGLQLDFVGCGAPAEATACAAVDPTASPTVTASSSPSDSPSPGPSPMPVTAPPTPAPTPAPTSAAVTLDPRMSRAVAVAVAWVVTLLF